MRKVVTVVLLIVFLLSLGAVTSIQAGSGGGNCDVAALNTYLWQRRAILNVPHQAAQFYVNNALTLQQVLILNQMSGITYAKLPAPTECAGVEELRFYTMTAMLLMDQAYTCNGEETCMQVVDDNMAWVQSQRDPILLALYVQAGIDENDSDFQNVLPPGWDWSIIINSGPTEPIY